MEAGSGRRTTYQSLINAKEVYIHMFCSKGLGQGSSLHRALLGQKKQESILPGRYARNLCSVPLIATSPRLTSTLRLLQAALQQGNVSAPLDTKVQTGADREVLVLVGLPGQCLSFRCHGPRFATVESVNQLMCTVGSGKSTWATRYVANHPEKRYAVLSVDGVIKQLKVRMAACCTACCRTPWAHRFIVSMHVASADNLITCYNRADHHCVCRNHTCCTCWIVPQQLHYTCLSMLLSLVL